MMFRCYQLQSVVFDLFASHKETASILDPPCECQLSCAGFLLFRRYFRVSVEQFDDLLSQVKDHT